MKGIVFTEFLDLVEEKFGLDMVDNILEASKLESEGAYTAIGTYEFNEMVQLMTHLSAATEIPVEELQYVFGKYLFQGLSQTHPEVIKNYSDPIDLVASIEDHIHFQVKKLYPDAELPSFAILERSENSLSLVYKSSRGLFHLAKGLIESSFAHYGRPASITYELLEQDGTRVKFDIKSDVGGQD